jgi:hypothetical protein
MGRGLSELQKTILRRAPSNRDREEAAGIDVAHCDVYAPEIAADYFGWPISRRFYDFNEDYRADNFHHLNRNNLRLGFRPRGTPEDQANRVRAAISRAMARLEKRNLGWAAHAGWGGWPRFGGFSLSPQGVETARQLELSVKLATRGF